MELLTIQKREKLNNVYAIDEKEPGDANHKYLITSKDTDLLEIVRHRLQWFQVEQYKSEYNEEALKHIEEALMWLNIRIKETWWSWIRQAFTIRICKIRT